MIIVTGWLEVDPFDRAGFVEGSAEAVRLARGTPGVWTSRCPRTPPSTTA